MKTIRDYYFKALHDEPPFMSGCALPSSEHHYKFEDCDFHPRLWEALQQMYCHCEFVGCNFKPQ